MLGIAFELDRAAFAGDHVQPASGTALGAGAGIDRGDARHLVLGLHQVRDELLDLVGGAPGEHGGAGTRDTDHREESASTEPVAVRGAVRGGSLPFVSHGVSAQ
jgi:hypothetical protein